LRRLFQRGQRAESHRLGGQNKPEEGDGEGDRQQDEAEQDRPTRDAPAAAAA
jgi:hypothetical protein